MEIRYVTAEEIADRVVQRIKAAAPTVEQFLAAGRDYDHTGRWDHDLMDDPYDEWSDLWRFSVGLSPEVENLLEDRK